MLSTHTHCSVSQPDPSCVSAHPVVSLLAHISCAAQLLLLENVRFYKEEEKNDAEFAKKVFFLKFSN